MLVKCDKTENRQLFNVNKNSLNVLTLESNPLSRAGHRLKNKSLRQF